MAVAVKGSPWQRKARQGKESREGEGRPSEAAEGGRRVGSLVVKRRQERERERERERPHDHMDGKQLSIGGGARPRDTAGELGQGTRAGGQYRVGRPPRRRVESGGRGRPSLLWTWSGGISGNQDPHTYCSPHREGGSEATATGESEEHFQDTQSEETCSR